MNKNKSVFQANTVAAHYPAVAQDHQADVAVIGGGITGVTAAYLLQKAGKKVILLEAYEIAKGATGNSTGNLYATVGNRGLQTIESKFNKETVKKVVAARTEAIRFIEEMVHKYAIACDFKKIDWYLFSNLKENEQYIQKEKEMALAAGLKADDHIHVMLPHTTGFAVRDQAQFNPYKYVVALAAKSKLNGVEIFENSKVLQVEEQHEKVVLHCEKGKITASQVVMATHTPKGFNILQTLLGPYREYAMTVKLNGSYPAPGTYWDLQESEHYSLRPYETVHGTVLLALGEVHKVGQKKNNDECFENIEKYLRKHFPVTSVEHRWAAQQYKPADMLPYIGTSPGHKNIYVATGFSADGLPYGTIAAMIITDAITGKKNEYANVFDTHRHTPIASAKDFIKENMNVALQYFKNLPLTAEANKFDEVEKGDGKIVEVHGHKCAAFRDAKGQLHLHSAYCPHMYCVVAFNKAEQTWDCPCHGSRFSCEGKVIEGPAYHDLKKIENGQM